jgi:hypothetical protein
MKSGAPASLKGGISNNSDYNCQFGNSAVTSPTSNTKIHFRGSSNHQQDSEKRLPMINSSK